MHERRIAQVIHIQSPIEQVWDALTNPDITERYWGSRAAPHQRLL